MKLTVFEYLNSSVNMVNLRSIDYKSRPAKMFLWGRHLCFSLTWNKIDKIWKLAYPPFFLSLHPGSNTGAVANIFKRLQWRHMNVTATQFTRNWTICSTACPDKNKENIQGQALIFSLVCAWVNAWVNNREAGDLRRHRVHYDVIVMNTVDPIPVEFWKMLANQLYEFTRNWSLAHRTTLN